MAHAGQTIVNPQSGETITFLQTSADTGGKLLQLECRVAPGRGLKIPPHMHPFQTQRFRVKSGAMEFLLGDQKQLLKAGDRITVPPKVYYNWSTFANEELVFVAEYEPAGHWEDIFESTFELARRAAAGQRINQFLASAVIMKHFPDQLRIKGMPAFVQDAVFSLSSVIGKLLGYKPVYRYGDPGK